MTKITTGRPGWIRVAVDGTTYEKTSAAEQEDDPGREPQGPVAGGYRVEARTSARLRDGRRDHRDQHHHRRGDEEVAPHRVGGQAALQRAGGAETEGQQQHREGEHDVHRTRQRGVNRAAVVAGDHSQRHADHEDQAGGYERHLERHARAVERAAEDVAPQRIRAHDVAVAGRGRRAERVEGVRVLVVGRMGAEDLDDQRREDRDEDEQDDEGQRGQRDLVLAQPCARTAPVASGRRSSPVAVAASSVIVPPVSWSSSAAPVLTAYGLASSRTSLMGPSPKCGARSPTRWPRLYSCWCRNSRTGAAVSIRSTMAFSSHP